MEKRFNIRVYGLLINKNGEILVSDEYRMGIFMTKFPGGGLKFGESTIDCLKREFLEETCIKIEVAGHFYTTDFFQPTYYLSEVQQLISIYYFVQSSELHLLKNISEKQFDFEAVKEGSQKFRWVKLTDLTEMNITLPIDKKVTSLLKQHIKSEN